MATVLIDTRERCPYEFENFPAERRALQTGDYTLRGFEGVISVERKELGDLIGCVGRGRKRFERELERLRGFRYHLVVVEAAWLDIMEGSWSYARKLKVSQVTGSILGWQAKGTNFFFAGDRDGGEYVTERYFRHFLTHRQRELEEIADELAQ